ncbi:GntR family transcriptional regulator [Acrocarpospora catenulata]|uniref:GntR family transcriptional regulator n=1 Tax=Acrocarpospora catenulata TaxID=2836182 RepID=UPI001BDB1CE1|nr:GntR family transcriptional regulator [Acrocarpospora catenulata]
MGRSSLVRQVQEDLRGRILDGSLPAGSQLPAEVDLARSMGVSRTSLREAVQQLQLDGLLIKRHGYGTFVRSTPPLRSALNVNKSTSELIRDQGMVPGTVAAQVRRAAVTPHEADRLGLAPDDPVMLTWEHYVPDAFEFVVQRRGPSLPPAAPGR